MSHSSKDQRSSQSKSKSSQNKAAKDDPRKDKTRRDVDDDFGEHAAKKLKPSQLLEPKYTIQPDNSQIDLTSILNSYLNIFQRIDFPTIETSQKNGRYKEAMGLIDSSVKPNFILVKSIATSQNEYIQNNSMDLFKENVTIDTGNIESYKAKLLDTFKATNTIPWEEEPGEKLPRVIQVSHNVMVQSNQKLLEMEDKLEKLEISLKEKRKIDAEFNKNIHLASLAIARAQLAVDIADKKF